MLALLSPPSTSFCPYNICTAVLSAGAPQDALELLTARGRSAQMAGGGVKRVAPGGGGWQVETEAPIWPWCWRCALGHLQRFLNRKPVRSWKSPCAKTLYTLGGLREVERGRMGFKCCSRY